MLFHRGNRKSPVGDIFRSARNEELGMYPRQIEVEPPKQDLERKEPSWKEETTIVKKAGSSSTPGPNGRCSRNS
jgi:hypothetical protein